MIPKDELIEFNFCQNTGKYSVKISDCFDKNNISIIIIYHIFDIKSIISSQKINLFHAKLYNDIKIMNFSKAV